MVDVIEITVIIVEDTTESDVNNKWYLGVVTIFVEIFDSVITLLLLSLLKEIITLVVTGVSDDVIDVVKTLYGVIIIGQTDSLVSINDLDSGVNELSNDKWDGSTASISVVELASTRLIGSSHGRVFCNAKHKQTNYILNWFRMENFKKSFIQLQK